MLKKKKRRKKKRKKEKKGKKKGLSTPDLASIHSHDPKKRMYKKEMKKKGKMTKIQTAGPPKFKSYMLLPSLCPIRRIIWGAVKPSTMTSSSSPRTWFP